MKFLSLTLTCLFAASILFSNPILANSDKFNEKEYLLKDEKEWGKINALTVVFKNKTYHPSVKDISLESVNKKIQENEDKIAKLKEFSEKIVPVFLQEKDLNKLENYFDRMGEFYTMQDDILISIYEGYYTPKTLKGYVNMYYHFNKNMLKAYEHMEKMGYEFGMSIDSFNAQKEKFLNELVDVQFPIMVRSYNDLFLLCLYVRKDQKSCLNENPFATKYPNEFIKNYK